MRLNLEMSWFKYMYLGRKLLRYDQFVNDHAAKGLLKRYMRIHN